MSLKITERQKEIFEFIKEFVQTNGFPPTYREIGKNFSISSTFGVKRHIDALVKKGYLNIESNSSRSISISSEHRDENQNNSDNANISSVPLVGRVAAGYPILAEENIEDHIKVGSDIISNKQGCFALKVRGDSMINAGILEGDIVIVYPQKIANQNDIIVALLGDEATLKRLIKVQNRLCLMPENNNYPLIEVNNREDFQIVGKVVSVLRFYN